MPLAYHHCDPDLTPDVDSGHDKYPPLKVSVFLVFGFYDFLHFVRRRSTNIRTKLRVYQFVELSL